MAAHDVMAALRTIEERGKLALTDLGEAARLLEAGETMAKRRTARQGRRRQREPAPSAVALLGAGASGRGPAWAAMQGRALIASQRARALRAMDRVRLIVDALGDVRRAARVRASAAADALDGPTAAALRSVALRAASAEQALPVTPPPRQVGRETGRKAVQRRGMAGGDFYGSPGSAGSASPASGAGQEASPLRPEAPASGALMAVHAPDRRAVLGVFGAASRRGGRERAGAALSVADRAVTAATAEAWAGREAARKLALLASIGVLARPGVGPPPASAQDAAARAEPHVGALPREEDVRAVLDRWAGPRARGAWAEERDDGSVRRARPGAGTPGYPGGFTDEAPMCAMRSSATG